MENAVSVHALIDFVLPPSDLMPGGLSAARLTEGSQIHRHYQSLAGEHYQSEVFFSYQFEGEETLYISGRADGLMEENGLTEIEELKSTLSDPDTLSPSSQHLAQLYCYAAMYCLSCGVSSVRVRLVYIQVGSLKQKSFSQDLGADFLIETFFSYCRSYAHELYLQNEHKRLRNEALTSLSFPFPSFRPGQRDLSAAVYRSIRDQSLLMAQAPTGVGKTLAVLFPALKALSQGYGERIFYLSARGTIQSLAEHAVGQMMPPGFPFTSVTLTAREKCCPVPGCSCHPSECSRAAGFFDRLPAAITEAESIGFCSSGVIASIAEKHHLCPFEFSLALSSCADLIICDYNYVFDPRVHLRRFFDEKNDHILLIDESHNLVDRARECYSASLSWEDVMQLRRVLPSGKLKGALGHHKQCVGDLQNFFVSLRKKLQSSAPDFSVFSSPPEDLINLLDAFLASAEPFLQEDTGFSTQLFSLYFSAKSFVRVAKDFDDCFRVLVKTAGSDVVIRLYCLDPASRLKKSYALCRSSVFFSATLSPSAHFQRMLGLEEARQIQIPSPFPPKNLKVLLSTSISTAYRDREKTLDALCRQIFAYYQARPGRYAVFFPSHSYLKAAHERFSELFPLVDAPCQQTCMTLEEREQFLFRFEEDRPMLAFAVMGGLFSEGVDLTGDRLEGAIIVGVGLPQPDEEQEALKDYFLSHGEDGFSHAYLYPGWIRVLQAAGRVIRTPEDRGVLLLIDPRFSHSRYVRLFPPAWEGAQRIADERSLSLALEDFWRPQAQKKE